LQAGALATLALIGSLRGLGTFYHLALAAMLGLFCYQHFLIRDRAREGCLRAFLNNAVVGLAFFIGVVLETQLAPLLWRAAAAGGSAS
jgi:4-hydroxybenzoate polyprenyltransferase